MTRTLPAAVSTAIALGGIGYAVTDLLQLEFGSGTLRWTTAAVDLTWGGFTWTAVGGALAVGDPTESTDESAAGVPLVFSGNDAAVISVLLGQTYLGRRAKVYRAVLTVATGAIEAVLLFDGFMNDGFKIRDERDQVSGGGSVVIETRLTARLGELARVRGIRTNVDSHGQFYANDSLFRATPQLGGRLVDWGVLRSIPPADYPGETQVGGFTRTPV